MSFEIKIDEALSLRLHEPRYAEEVYNVAIANREHINRWMPFLCDSYDLEASREHARGCLKGFAERKQLTLTVLEHGKVAGSTGWTDWHQQALFDGRLEYASADIGYWLSQDATGRGLMTRAVRAMTTLAFAEYGLKRLTIRAEPENEASWRVAERAGYRYEGLLRGVATFDGRVVNHKLYAMLAEEWKG
ncbi:MAG: GNAT family N-acetyltransferase [Phycisphaeraceae bacterium]|nr:GNAT family N-acetyltransferase [Phycisphaeraceae bacterium]